jgi:hypothetical protein
MRQEISDNLIALVPALERVLKRLTDSYSAQATALYRVGHNDPHKLLIGSPLERKISGIHELLRHAQKRGAA